MPNAPVPRGVSLPRARLRSLAALLVTVGLLQVTLGAMVVLMAPGDILGGPVETVSRGVETVSRGVGTVSGGVGQVVTSLRIWSAAGLPFGTRSPESALRAAVARAHAAGSYRFSAESRQTLTPRPRASNLGRGSERTGATFDGAVALPDQSRMDVSASGQPARPGAAKAAHAALIRDGGRTFVERDGKIERMDSAAGLASPTVDLLGYLAGARDVTRLDTRDTAGGRVEVYRFAIDGPALARYVRDQTERSLAGELPPNVRLAPAPMLEAMSGFGEVWVDEAGFPRRQVIHFSVPELNDQYDGAGDLTVDFRDYGKVGALPHIVEGADGAWHAAGATAAPGAPDLSGLARSALGLFSMALFAAIGLVAALHRRRRSVYAAIVTATCFSLVAGPLLQGWQVSRFFARQAEAAARADSAGPLGLVAAEAGRSGSPDAGLGGAARPPAAVLAQAPGSPPERNCTSANSQSADYDNDGLADAYEGCLGSNPASPDTDSDMINDGLEVQGFQSGGKTWTSDPIRADTNADGITDGSEWAKPNGTAPSPDVDGDGLPNVWDPDNDGDGVSDGMDLSADTVAAYAPTFDLSIERPDGDTTDAQSYAIVQIQVQPEDSAHLRYSLTPLDWPPDQAGQIQNLGSTPTDVNLVPILIAKSNISPSLSLRYGVAVAKNTDSDSGTYPYELYIPLQPAASDGAVATMFGALAYTPAEAQNVQLVAQMAWMVQAELDQWQDCAADTTPSAANCDGYSSQIGTVQVYTEPDLRVSGMQVVKSGPTQVATFGTPETPANDASLFQLMVGLGATYLVSSTITLTDVVKTARDPSATTAERFNITTPVDVAWSGDDPDPGDYAYRDIAMATTTQTTTVQFLSTHYDESDNPSLVYAFQQTGGVADLGDAPLTSSGGTVATTVNLANITTLVQRGIKLTMYEYASNTWTSLGYDDTMGVAVEREPDLPESTQFLESYFYAAFVAGQISVVAVDGIVYANSTADIESIAATINTGSWSTVSYWIDSYAKLAGVDDDIFAGDSVMDSLSKIGTYTQTVVGSSLAVLTVVASLILVALSALALANGAQIAADIVAGIDDAFVVIASSLTIVMGVAALAASSDTVVQPVEEANKAIDELPDDFQIGDDPGSGEGGSAIDAATDAAEGSMTFGSSLAMIGLVIQVSIVLITTLLVIFNAGGNPQVVAMALANAMATLIVVVALFLVSLIPGVGQIIVAAIFLLNLFIEFVTWLTFGQGFNVLGWFIDALANIIYHSKLLTEVTDVASDPPSVTLLDEEAGVTAGNTVYLSAKVHTTIGVTNLNSLNALHLSWANTYWSGSLTTDAQPVGAPGPTPGVCIVNDQTFTSNCVNSAQAAWKLEAMINAVLELTTFVNYRLAVENVVAEHEVWVSQTTGTAPDPTSSEDVQNATSPIYLDVLPATIDELWTWNAIQNNDLDADGLTNSQESGTTLTSPTLWDSDGDGLSDGVEVQGQPAVNIPAQGTSALAADTDGDGLGDKLELAFGTAPDQADTDGDGLTDGEEVCQVVLSQGNWVQQGGWLAEIPNGMSMAEVPVCSNPNDPDADGDGRSDGQEKADQTSPFAPNTGMPFVSLSTTPFAEGPQGQAGTFVAPGDALGVALFLNNQGNEPITSSLSLCVPSTFKDVQQTLGPPGTISTGACGDPAGATFTWPYSNDSPLAAGAELNVAFSAQAGGASASTDWLLHASLPYSATVISDNASVVVDVDNPTATVLSPENGAVLSGETTVVGGTATDPTSWASQVAVNLGQPSGWTEIIDAATQLQPWSATWTLPADGTYTVSALATDEVGNESAIAQSTVLVDNTAPSVAVDVADGAVLLGATVDRYSVSYTLTGTAADNLSGLMSVDLSIDGNPWVSATLAPASGFPTSATWSYAWRLPRAGAQGSHRIVARSTDRAGNVSALQGRDALLDAVPPGVHLTVAPPGLPAGRAITLHGHADDAALLARPAVPAVLAGALDAVKNATVWLGAASGSTAEAASWLGDVNGDGRDDLAVGSTTAGGAGQVELLYGRATGWPVPGAQQALAADGSTFMGDPYGVGTAIASAGDFDGDGYDDFLIGDPWKSQAFLVYGQPTPYGTNVLLAGNGITMTVITDPIDPDTSLGQWIAPAGDVNGDGFADVLLGAGHTTSYAYLVLGQAARPQSMDTDFALGLPFPASGAPALGVGDVDGDHLDDIVVADPDNQLGSHSGGARKPAVYLYLGSRLKGLYGIASLSDALAITSGGGALGHSVAALGDVDGNGMDDFAFTTGGDPQVALGPPGFDIYGLPISMPTQSLSGFGSGVAYLAGVGDVDDDGRPDLVVGQTGNQAALVLGASPFPVSPPIAATISNVAAVGTRSPTTRSDCNCDGSSDLLVLPPPGALEGLSSSQSLLHRPMPSVRSGLPTQAAATLRVGSVPPHPETRLRGGLMSWLGGPLSALNAGPSAVPSEVWVSPAYCAGCGNDGHNWQVDAFASIQDAIASQSPMVYIGPGSYAEVVSLSGSVRLVGSGADLTVLRPPAAGLGTASALVSVSGGSGGLLSGVTLAGAGQGTGLAIGGGQGFVARRVVVRNFGNGVTLSGNATASQIVNTTFVGNGNGVTASACSPLNVRNSIFAYHSNAGIIYGAQGCPAATIQYNLFWRNGTGAASDVVQDALPTDASNVGIGQVLADPLFENVTAADFHLRPGSPAIDAGAPTDTPPPVSGLRMDIGYSQLDQGVAYADARYCATCPNDGLEWGVDAFQTINGAVAAALALVPLYGCGAAGGGCPGGLTVVVGPGSYSEAITLPSHIRLVGSGADRTILSPAASVPRGFPGGVAVWVDDATDVLVGGFRFETKGDTGVAVTGASSAITVTRNVFNGDNEFGFGGTAVVFSGPARGAAFYNTVIDVGFGISVSAAGRLLAMNNIFANSLLTGDALQVSGTGAGPKPQVLSKNNLFYSFASNYPLGAGTYDASGDLTHVDPMFSDSSYHLQPDSPALGAAAPGVPPSDGGGGSDLGYYQSSGELQATLLFGAAGETCDYASSGMAGVEVGLGLLNAPDQPLTATLPTSWASAALSATGQTGSFWSAAVTAGADTGMYRLYSKGTDRAGNHLTTLLGTYLADGATPVVTLLTPANNAVLQGPSLTMVAEVSDPVSVFGDTVFNGVAGWFLVNGQQQVQGRWLDPVPLPDATVRRFGATVTLNGGNSSVQAFARDGAGNVGSSGSATIVAPAQAVGQVTAPHNGQAVRTATVPVLGVVRSPGDQPVSLYVNGQRVGTAQLAQPASETTSFSGQVTLSGEVTHTLQALVTGGTLSAAPATAVRLDMTPPTIAVNSATDKMVTRDPMTFRGTAADSGSGLALVQLSSDGGATWATALLTRTKVSPSPWSIVWTPAAGTDGATIALRFRATDVAGNVAAATQTVTVDDTPPATPAATFQYCPAATCSPVSLGATLSGPGTLQVSWRSPVLDGSGSATVGVVVNQSSTPPKPTTFTAFTSAQPFTQAFSPSTAGGAWYVHLAAWDALGNTRMISYPFQYDPNPTLAATARAVQASRMVGVPAQSGLGPVPVVTGGRPESPAPLRLAEQSPPTVRFHAPSAFTARTGPHRFTGSSDDGSGSGVMRVELRTSGGPWRLARGTRHWSIVVPAPAGGSFQVEARAVDGAGNISPIIARTVRVDNTSPTASQIVPNGVPGRTMIVEVAAGDASPASGRVRAVQVQVDNGPWRAATRIGRSGGQSLWRFEWRWAEGVGSYRFRARAVDMAGNISAPRPSRTVHAVADPSADLAVSQLAPTSAVPGSSLRYALRVRNAGPATARGVVLVDSLPGEVMVAQKDPACGAQGGALVCNMGDLAPGDSRELGFIVELPASVSATQLLNVATVRSGVPDPRPGDNRSEAWSAVGPRLFLPSVAK